MKLNGINFNLRRKKVSTSVQKKCKDFPVEQTKKTVAT